MGTWVFRIVVIGFVCIAAGCWAAADDLQAAEALVRQFRPAPPPLDGKVEYEDLNGDGKPDVLRTTVNGFLSSGLMMTET